MEVFFSFCLAVVVVSTSSSRAGAGALRIVYGGCSCCCFSLVIVVVPFCLPAVVVFYLALVYKIISADSVNNIFNILRRMFPQINSHMRLIFRPV